MCSYRLVLDNGDPCKVIRCIFRVDKVCATGAGVQVVWPMVCVVPVYGRWLWHVQWFVACMYRCIRGLKCWSLIAKRKWHYYR
jgi:hypothetical protein